MSIKLKDEIKHWFAFYTKPRQEFKAQQQFLSISVEHYLPTIETVKQWKDRKKKITEPLFPGYIFVYGNERERMKALQQSSIVRTVCFNGKPSVIPDYQIENIKILLAENPKILVTNKIKSGSSVKIIDGPFKGIIGKVNTINNEKWLIVSIDLLQRSVLVHLPIDSVVKCV